MSFLSNLIIENITLISLLLTIVGLIVLWVVVVSIPVWLACKAITGGKASFGEAMIATLFG